MTDPHDTRSDPSQIAEYLATSVGIRIKRIVEERFDGWDGKFDVEGYQLVVSLSMTKRG